MFKVIFTDTTTQERSTFQHDTIEKAAEHIANYHELMRQMGEVQGRDYDVVLLSSN